MYSRGRSDAPIHHHLALIRPCLFFFGVLCAEETWIHKKRWQVGRFQGEIATVYLFCLLHPGAASSHLTWLNRSDFADRKAISAEQGGCKEEQAEEKGANKDP